MLVGPGANTRKLCTSNVSNLSKLVKAMKSTTFTDCEQAAPSSPVLRMLQKEYQTIQSWTAGLQRCALCMLHGLPKQHRGSERK